jgi:hypothetical protein
MLVQRGIEGGSHVRTSGIRPPWRAPPKSRIAGNSELCRARGRLHDVRQCAPGHVSTNSPSDSYRGGGADGDTVTRPRPHGDAGGNPPSNRKTHPKTDAEADAKANT